MNDPWAFGWNQIFTLIGFGITIVIAFSGFRTFGRWKKEKIEEKKIDTAIDALAMSYESKFIFDSIRSPMAYGPEWKDMPEFPGDDEGMRSQRGIFFATLKRVEACKDFFDRAWKLQVRCAAIFGPQMEEIFLELQKARREVEVAAGMLMNDPHPTHRSADNVKHWEKMRAAIWAGWGAHTAEGDVVGAKLDSFRKGVERKCRPIVDREYRL